MHRQPVQISTLASACASPLHSASCAVDKSINTRAYASVYVRLCPYAEQRVGPRWPWSASVIGWNASASLRWPWKFNMFELWRRQSAYARVCAGRNRWQKYKQLRRQSACTRVCARIHGHTCAWSINPTLPDIHISWVYSEHGTNYVYRQIYCVTHHPPQVCSQIYCVTQPPVLCMQSDILCNTASRPMYAVRYTV